MSIKVKIKTVLYWLSVVRPIADIVIGAVKGIADAWKQINSDERLAKEREQLKIDTQLPFLSLDGHIDLKSDDEVSQENENGENGTRN